MFSIAIFSTKFKTTTVKYLHNYYDYLKYNTEKTDIFSIIKDEKSNMSIDQVLFIKSQQYSRC